MAQETQTSKARYVAVVESGSCSEDHRYWEERRTCGHLHKTYEAAEKCGAKHYDAHTGPLGWHANADWHGYRIHNQHGERVNEAGETGREEYDRMMKESFGGAL